MKLLRFKNRNSLHWWVFCNSVEEGQQISLEEGYVRAIENAKFVRDSTANYVDTTDMADVNVTGIAHLHFPERKWIVTRNQQKVKDYR